MCTFTVGCVCVYIYVELLSHGLAGGRKHLEPKSTESVCLTYLVALCSLLAIPVGILG